MAASKGNGGRKSKLTPELQKEMEKLFASGVTIKTACDYVGISTVTFHNWMNRGQEGDSGNSQYINFFEVIKKAQAVPLTESIAIVRKAARPLFNEKYDDEGNVIERTLVNGGSWQAAAWILERKDPANYAKTVNYRIEGLDTLVKLAKELGHKPESVIADVVAVLEEERRERLH